jgi:hypothetical protein
MVANKATIVWAICMLAYVTPAIAEGGKKQGGAAAAACAAAPNVLVGPARQDAAVRQTGRIPGLGTVHGSVGWDNRTSLSLVGAQFVVQRTLDPLTRRIEISISGTSESALVIRLGGGEPLEVTRGTQTVDLSDPRSVREALDGVAVASFRELVGNYERMVMQRRVAPRADDPHADGFLLVGAFLSSLAGDPAAMGRARDLILQRIYGKLRAARFDFKDCVTDYELYLLKIDTQRTQCLDAANSRDSWYARAADRLGCETEFMAQALAGEGQFASCTMLGAMFA